MKSDAIGDIRTGVCANLYNAYLTANAISAAWELGLLDAIREGPVGLDEFCGQQSLDAGIVEEIARALLVSDIVTVTMDPTTISAGPNFAEIYQVKGIFFWATKGSSSVFVHAATIARSGWSEEPALARDPSAIAKGCADIGRLFIDPAFHRIVGRANPRNIVDLGCGRATRLIDLLILDSTRRGLGIELSAGALADARVAVQDAGLADRIDLLQGDARSLDPDPRLADADTIISYLTGHDLWPFQNCIGALDRLRELAPRARNFYLVDTYRTANPWTDRPPLFTLGFELAHQLMDTYIPTREEWLAAFDASAWRCVGTHELAMPPNTALFNLVPR
ncbi:SAM-dependent methyltransferase [Nocardia gamkensis]|uniref:Methyltransferase domain-containing protein n=1 Tax=Nocardia gamkensis TaxID=352869 RepID=A0A7X6R180_9NOCA|nr:class I SAM-dependent methyltransferase [Nocardia gamkensis]NKY24941.1 methyltransferase domain-containing protein [Nocardia gamkensis]NQE66720.1 Phenylpyruvate C(3)-methyltransferase [Nocardia gamkensis]